MSPLSTRKQTVNTNFAIHLVVAMEHVHRLVVKVACVVMPQRIVANHEVGHAGQEQEVEAQHQCVEPQAVRVPVNRSAVCVHGGQHCLFTTVYVGQQCIVTLSVYVGQ